MISLGESLMVFLAYHPYFSSLGTLVALPSGGKKIVGWIRSVSEQALGGIPLVLGLINFYVSVPMALAIATCILW